MRSRPIVVMGPSGSGKSTIGALVADALDALFIDADDLHPRPNREKMAAGVALDDEDRAPWLAAVAEAITDASREGAQVVAACSALKRAYRDVLRDGAPGTVFVYLDGTAELLAERLGHRKGHFMPTSLLESQLASLEPLADDEDGVVVGIDASPAEIVERALAALRSIG